MTTNKTSKSAPIRRCIYCREEPPDQVKFGREHIIPEGLLCAERIEKGFQAMTLLEASCRDCERITSAMEGHLINKSFWVLRSIFGRDAVGSNPKFTLNGAGWAGFFPGFEMPSILKGPDAPLNETFRICVISHEHIVYKPSPLQQVKVPKVRLREPQFSIDNERLARFLAKIAHCAAVAEYGLDSLEPFLPDIVLGKVTDIRQMWVYVGGITDLAQEPSKQTHEINVMPMLSHDRLPYIGVTIRLFSPIKAMPTYFVVAGRLREDTQESEA